MYSPRSFTVDDLPTLHRLIERYGFGILFSGGDEPAATHLPFLIDPGRGPNGTLIAHMARANPHWKRFDASTRALVAFTGPHAYISPGWYADPVNVPTWNYAAVHAYGTPSRIEDAAKLRELVAALVRRHEADRRPSWRMEQADAIIETELRGIVGIEIPIDRIEGTFKFNQHMSRKDRQGVVHALASSSETREREVAKLMESELAAGATTARAARGPAEAPVRAAASGGAESPGDAVWASDWIGRWARGW